MPIIIASVKRAVYFGCDTNGHYLYLPGMINSYHFLERIPGFPWTLGLLDTGLLKNGEHVDIYDGKVFWTCGGTPLWLAFFWWDRSGDKRHNSNSSFYVQGFDIEHRQEAFDYAGTMFPQIITRQKYPLVLQ